MRISCAGCHTGTDYHSVNGLLNLRQLGYSDKEARELTSPELYFTKLVEKQKEGW